MATYDNYNINALKHELKAIRDLMKVTSNPIRLEILRTWLEESKRNLKIEESIPKNDDYYGLKQD